MAGGGQVEDSVWLCKKKNFFGAKQNQIIFGLVRFGGLDQLQDSKKDKPRNHTGNQVILIKNEPRNRGIKLQ